jgi:hypothetical protein
MRLMGGLPRLRLGAIFQVHLVPVFTREQISYYVTRSPVSDSTKVASHTYE